MKGKKMAGGKAARSRAEILAAMAALPVSLQGRICEDRRVLADGTVRIYHNLQYWKDGKNHKIHIPEDRLAAFEAAVKNGAAAKRLLYELSDASAAELLPGAFPAEARSEKNEPEASS